MPHLNDVRLTLEILEAGRDERDHLVAADLGRDELGMRAVVLEQRFR